jgi:hypothetical protein
MIEVCSFKSINALTGAKRRLALKKNSKTMRPRKNATQKTATTLSPRRTVGIDLGDQTSHYCILDEQGEVVSEGTVRTTEAGFREQFGRMTRARIVIETGTHSPWVSRHLEQLGHEVLVANARQVRVIFDNDRKTDKVDARTLARLARVDQGLLHPIRHRSAEAQADRTRARPHATRHGDTQTRSPHRRGERTHRNPQVLIHLHVDDFDFCPQYGNARVPPKVFGTSTRRPIVGHNQQGRFSVSTHLWIGNLSGPLCTCQSRLRIPAKPKFDSEGKPNGIQGDEQWSPARARRVIASWRGHPCRPIEPMIQPEIGARG